jgi:hypothetical protein
MLSRVLLVLLLAGLLVICFGNTASADPFQFVHATTGAFIAYAPVYMNKAFYGYTDMYGRINISVAHGKYNCLIIFLGRKLSKSLIITGSAKLNVELF